MALYQVTVLTDVRRPETPTLLAIAGITGKPVAELDVDRTKKSVGVVHVKVATTQMDVVASLRRLMNVQTVKPIGN